MTFHPPSSAFPSLGRSRERESSLNWNVNGSKVIQLEYFLSTTRWKCCLMHKLGGGSISNEGAASDGKYTDLQVCPQALHDHKMDDPVTWMALVKLLPTVADLSLGSTKPTTDDAQS